MRRFCSIVWVCCAAACAVQLCACRQGRTQKAAARSGQGATYDLRPLLVNLRDDVRRQLGRKLSASRLATLPLYEMKLELDPERARLSGRCDLHYRNNTGRPLSRLPLLLHPNAPREMGGGADAGELNITSVASRKGPAVRLVPRRPTLVELRFAQPVAARQAVVVHLAFNGRLRRLPAGSNDIFSQALASLGLGGAGSGASDYGLLAEGDGLFTVASAYPMVAPFSKGRFDQSPPGPFGDLAYNSLANYRVQITVPPGYRVVTNLADRELERGRGHLALGAANRDFVLLAGRKLQWAEKRLGQVVVRSVFRAADREGGQRSLSAAVDALELFQRRFGPYPYRQLDVAEATLVGGAGGVEFPGMVLIAGMLYQRPSRSTNPLAVLMRGLGGLMQLGRANPSASTEGTTAARRIDDYVEQMAVFTVAHEVAHQYFAGLIGSDARREPVLDEALAQYAAGEVLEQRLGAPHGGDVMDLNAKMSYAIHRLLGGPDLPAAQPVERFPSAVAYAGIVYGKAPYLYRELERKMKPGGFDRMLRAAVDAHRFELITLRQWLTTLRRHAGPDAALVQRLARRWLRQTHGDKDLGVDADGDVLLGAVLGEQGLAQLKQGLGALGLKPADLLRMLMAGQQRPTPAPGAQGAAPGEGTESLDDAMRQIERLLR